MILDKYGVPSIVQDISYHGLMHGYRVTYFDDSFLYILPENLVNDYQVQHSMWYQDTCDYEPIVKELERIWFERKTR